MIKFSLPLLFFLATYCHADFTEENPIHLLRPRSDISQEDLDFLSWRLGVETNNLRDWKLVPESFKNYVEKYMLKGQYENDCKVVAAAAIEYAQSIAPADGKALWVFDIDETTLSNLPYYEREDVQFGTKKYNRNNFQAWVHEQKSPAVPAVLELYKKVRSLNFKTVILTGSSETLRETREANLKKAGYTDWDWLIFKKESERGTSSVIFKSNKRTELVNEGYRIVGNVGDQWSDLLGPNAGERTFKVPDPMYYVG